MPGGFISHLAKRKASPEDLRRTPMADYFLVYGA